MTTTLGGRYELIRQLNVSGAWRIFEALDQHTGRRVTAKMPGAEGEYDLDTLLGFQREGALLRALKHPNIVEVYGAFVEGGTCYIISELPDALPLSRTLQSEQLSFERSGHIAHQVASALQYAHSRSIIHCDIKPGNILLDRDDQVKVVDFGFAGILVEGRATKSTMSGDYGEMPYYRAPEQIEGLPLDGRTDIYSLGAVLYHMVACRPPFAGTDQRNVAFARVNRDPEPPSALNPTVPRDLEGLVLKAMARNPAHRFQTAAETEAALAAWRGKQPATRHCPTCGNQVRAIARFCGHCGSKV